MKFGEGLAQVKRNEIVKRVGHNHVGVGRNKFNATKTLYNGILYDSKKEAGFAMKLDILRKASGKDRVIEIERQVTFSFDLNGHHICKYKPDFKVTYSDGRIEYIDVKGMETREFSIKKKLLKAFYGIDVKIV